MTPEGKLNVPRFFHADKLIVGGVAVCAFTQDEWVAIIDELVQVKHHSASGEEQNRPFFLTSTNGNVVARSAINSSFGAVLNKADFIDADGMSVVFASKIFHKNPIPERVPTTDLFGKVLQMCNDKSYSCYFLGGTDDVLKELEDKVRVMFPHVSIKGTRNGYFSRADEIDVVRDINNVKPDVLWVGMGVPTELEFVERNLEKLNVSVIKTCGGCYNFFSGRYRRAPLWMQSLGLEWLYRIFENPSKFAFRYLWTNIVASLALILLSRRK